MDLPPNAKLGEMQQNTHGPVQLIRADTPDAESISPTQGASHFEDCLVWIPGEAKHGGVIGGEWAQRDAGRTSAPPKQSARGGAPAWLPPGK